MITVAVTPPRAEKVTCGECHLEARPPIVVLVGKVGRCADRKACAMRQRRQANAEAAQKAGHARRGTTPR